MYDICVRSIDFDRFYDLDFGIVPTVETSKLNWCVEILASVPKIVLQSNRN